MTFKHSMSFERFLVGNIRNRMLQASVTLVTNMFQKTCKTLGYIEIIVSEIHRGEYHLNIP